MCHLSHKLAVPNMRWLGVFPSEIITMGFAKQELTEKEKAVTRAMLRRSYIQDMPMVKKELEVLAEKCWKCEIEGVMKCDDFLGRIYLPTKFYNRDFV